MEKLKEGAIFVSIGDKLDVEALNWLINWLKENCADVKRVITTTRWVLDDTEDDPDVNAAIVANRVRVEFGNAKVTATEMLDFINDGKGYRELAKLIATQQNRAGRKAPVVVTTHDKFFAKFSDFYSQYRYDLSYGTYIMPPLSLWVVGPNGARPIQVQS